MAELVPAAGAVAVAQLAAALMPFTPDGKPLIGRVEHPSLRPAPRLPAKFGAGVSGLFVVSGLGSKGFMQGATAGQMLGRMVLDGTVELTLLGASPRRFLRSALPAAQRGANRPVGGPPGAARAAASARI